MLFPLADEQTGDDESHPDKRRQGGMLGWNDDPAKCRTTEWNNELPEVEAGYLDLAEQVEPDGKGGCGNNSKP